MLTRKTGRAISKLQRRCITSTPLKDVDAVQITTLPNKLRVATQNTPGHFSALGIYVDAGSRYESPRTSGVSHILDRMAFKATKNRTAAEMSTAVDSLGGQILCSSSRETLMYQSSHFPSSTPLALDLLSDTVLNPLFLPEEIISQREAAAYEVREISNKPEMILPEILHEVAYRDNTLGNPVLCPEDRLHLITSDSLKEYLRTWFRPERMVVAGAGMPHAQLVELVQEHFRDLHSPTIQPPPPSSELPSRSIPSHLLAQPKPSPSLYKSLSTAATSLLSSTAPALDESFEALSAAPARYTGGHKFIYNRESELNHVYLGFEGLSIHDDDIYTLATMQILLGGGGSFSAGGPGKGMYSRLYTHVLNHHSAIDHCSSFHHIYTDSSIFGLVASSFESYTPNTVLPILLHQLSLLLHSYSSIHPSELSRAKNQLMSSLVMSLESRSVEVEDLGRQVLVHGRKIGIEEMLEKIEKVTSDDVRRVARKVFGDEMNGEPSILVMGKEDVGDWKKMFRKYGVGKL